MRFLKKSFSIILSMLLFMVCSACTKTNNDFAVKQNGNIASASGVEYSHLAYEGNLYYLGELAFQGRVNGEKRTSQHLGITYKTGMFSIKNSETDNILIRKYPDNEWFGIYRKTSLPPFDFSVDNCCRLELVLGSGNRKDDAIHLTCGDGISDSLVIAEFLNDVRAQKTPREAGLYDLIKNPDGSLENCYVYAIIYGFFEEEPNLAIQMEILSYNDLAYSVSIEGKDYVLSQTWIQKLQNK